MSRPLILSSEVSYRLQTLSHLVIHVHQHHTQHPMIFTIWSCNFPPLTFFSLFTLCSCSLTSNITRQVCRKYWSRLLTICCGHNLSEVIHDCQIGSRSSKLVSSSSKLFIFVTSCFGVARYFYFCFWTFEIDFYLPFATRLPSLAPAFSFNLASSYSLWDMRLFSIFSNFNILMFLIFKFKLQLQVR